MNPKLFLGTLAITFVFGGIFLYAAVRVAEVHSTPDTGEVAVVPDPSLPTLTPVTVLVDDVARGDDDPVNDDDDDTIKAPAKTVPPTTKPPATPTTPPAKPPTTSGYTLASIASHDDASSCYMAIRGKVYDVTKYISKHPGGNTILAGCGKDATADFEGIRGHLKQKTLDLLPGYYLGPLEG